VQPAEYFRFLWGDESGMALVALIDQGAAQGQMGRRKFFMWPSQAEQMVAYVEKHAGKDVYTSPSLFAGSQATKAGARVLRVVHADADGFDVSQARVQPSLIVHSSPGHTHLYWSIIDTTDPNVVEALSRGFASAHPKDTDEVDHGWARNKLLRVPGTSNTSYANPNNKKYVEGAPVYEVTAEYMGGEFSSDEFAAYYEPSLAVQIEAKDRGDMPSKAEALQSIKATATLTEMLDKRHAMGVDRSDALFLLQNELFRAGASDEAVFVLCKDHPFNKHKTEDRLWEDILRARAKATEASMPRADYEEDEADFETTVAARSVDSSVDFLYDDEKDALRPSFVSEYLAWAESKTDANPEFHVAMAFTLLSVVFSDHGHALPNFGALPLNMWFMVLGETTRSRKSTAKNLMLKMLNELADEDHKYDLGSDFTGEALDNELLKMPYRSALAYVDEVQGLLEAMEKKSYMAGMKGKLTELFDGWVVGKLRATGEAKRQSRVPVSFCFLAMGIREKAADVMTHEDFESGFLTRFCYVQADAPKRTKESDYLAQADPNQFSMGDPVLIALADKLRRARDHWESFHPVTEAEGGPQPTIPVPCAPEAWERLNMFISDVLDAAEGHNRASIIEASSHRLSLAILKAATLLAMYECCDEVQLSHMLTAISYGAQWFYHMTVMAEKVSSSVFRKKQNAVIDYLFEMGSKSTWPKTRRKFRDWMNREFADVVDALVSSGVVDIDDHRNLTLTRLGEMEAAA
jgi:hypothetical protein